MEKHTIDQIEKQVEATPSRKNDTHSYRGWLSSDHFYKRALAIFGYSLAGQLLIALLLIALGMSVGLAGFIFSAF